MLITPCSLPLQKITEFYPAFCPGFSEDQKVAANRKEHVAALQKKVNILQNELRNEIKKSKDNESVSDFTVFAFVLNKGISR